MATQIDVRDHRIARAVAIFAGSTGWKSVDRDGVRYFLVPSQTDNRTYFVSEHTCGCEDQVKHPEIACKHRMAVQLYIAVQNASQE
jgi:hypothetical protein